MNKTNSLYRFDREGIKPKDFVLGIDEVGRGCWAGDLVVCGVLLDGNYHNEAINDSKQLTAQQREAIFADILKHNLRYVIKTMDAKTIDIYGPKAGTQMLMKEIVNELGKDACKILIDYEQIQGSSYEAKSIVKGDQISFAIATASIIAKVYRDNKLIALGKKYPEYGFESHKGYGTKKHLNALQKYGPITGIHRFSYKPVKMNGK